MASIQGIINADIDTIKGLSDADLRHNVTMAVSAANKRLARMEKANLNPPARREVERTGGRFSVAGKNRTQLLKELQRIQEFYSMETSTIKGAKKHFEKVKAGMKDTLKSRGELTEEAAADIDELTNDERDQIWEAFDKMRELKPNDFNYKEWMAKAAEWASKGRSSNQIAGYIKGAITRLEKARDLEIDKANEDFERNVQNSNNFDNAEYQDIFR